MAVAPMAKAKANEVKVFMVKSPGEDGWLLGNSMCSAGAKRNSVDHIV
jgi:hypothetical protein